MELSNRKINVFNEPTNLCFGRLNDGKSDHKIQLPIFGVLVLRFGRLLHTIKTLIPCFCVSRSVKISSYNANARFGASCASFNQKVMNEREKKRNKIFPRVNETVGALTLVAQQRKIFVKLKKNGKCKSHTKQATAERLQIWINKFQMNTTSGRRVNHCCVMRANLMSEREREERESAVVVWILHENGNNDQPIYAIYQLRRPTRRHQFEYLRWLRKYSRWLRAICMCSNVRSVWRVSFLVCVRIRHYAHIRGNKIIIYSVRGRLFVRPKRTATLRHDTSQI